MPDSQLADCPDNILTPVSNVMVTVDGKKVDVSGSYDKSDFFSVTFPQDPAAFWGEIKPGTYRAIATGYFLFLNDIAQGEHTIDMKVVDSLKGNEDLHLSLIHQEKPLLKFRYNKRKIEE